MKPQPRRMASPRTTVAALAVLVVFSVPWLVGAAWLTARAVQWASPHVMRGDGLVLTIVAAGGVLVTWLLVSWPLPHGDLRDADRASKARADLHPRNVLRPTSGRRPACPPAPRHGGTR